jgi:serine/threonine-protein kinase HipA
MVRHQTATLCIIHESQEVADLSYDFQRDAFNFSYRPEWQNKGFPLSPHLPLFGEILPENTKIFLENLLPEGDALKKLARTLKITPSSIFALIAAVGKDATGAFSFTQEGQKIETTFRPIPKSELISRIQERATKSIAIWDRKPRLSLAGVQDKLAVTLRGGEYGLGEGELASTHILKFSKIDQHLVINEFYCMKLAEKANLPVAKVEIVQLGEKVLSVERFDRAWMTENHVVRHHIIDGCQALNTSPDFKYQRIVPVGPHRDDYLSPISVENLSAFNKICIVPAKAQLQLLHWILFNLIIGNTDNHGKNISYFVNKNGIMIAPHYDLLNVTIYEDFHQELAFKIGDTFVLDEVKAYQLAEMSKQMNLSPRIVSIHLKKLCQKVLKHSSEVLIEGLSSFELAFLQKIRSNISMRAEMFLRQSNEISVAFKHL